MESIVDQILAAKAENPKANVSDQESKINHLVARLFNLTDKEIEILEGEGKTDQTIKRTN